MGERYGGRVSAFAICGISNGCGAFLGPLPASGRSTGQLGWGCSRGRALLARAVEGECDAGGANKKGPALRLCGGSTDPRGGVNLLNARGDEISTLMRFPARVGGQSYIFPFIARVLFVLLTFCRGRCDGSGMGMGRREAQICRCAERYPSPACPSGWLEASG
jgi:hypothetical protein